MTQGSNSIYTTSGDTDGHTFDKKMFAEDLQKRLASHRDVFVIDADDWIAGSDAEVRASAKDHKHVSRAALKLLLDYCTEDWPNMTIVEYAAAVFHSREPTKDETLFSLLPDVQQRLDADRLGLGHIYSK